MMQEAGMAEWQEVLAATFPDGNYVDWIGENYEYRQRGRKIEDGFEVVCKRCGMADIFSLFRHAHNVHGDDVPANGPKAHLSDEQGRFVGGVLDQLRDENAELKRQLALRTDNRTPTS